MRPRFVLLFTATAATSVLVAIPSTQAQREAKALAFDPLFAPGAVCAPARAGRPPLLEKLVLAQAETRPFQPSQQPPAKTPPAKEGPPALYDDLGTLHVPVSTKHPKAQAYFDQGMRLAFAFNHAEAACAFRAAQALDPGCAMCYWGEALVLGPNINAPMFPEAVAPAVQAAASAVRLAKAGTPAEQAEQVFRTSLARTPSNGWALRGLMEVYRVRGDTAAFDATRQRFATTWLGKPEGPALSSL